MLDPLLALSTTFQTGFKIRICNLIGLVIVSLCEVALPTLKKTNTAFLGCYDQKGLFVSRDSVIFGRVVLPVPRFRAGGVIKSVK